MKRPLRSTDPSPVRLNRAGSVLRDPAVSRIGLSSVPIRIHLFAWGGILGLVLLLACISSHRDGRNIWNDWTESRELRKPDYSERIYPEKVFRTQANTWSNLAYVLVGLYSVGLGSHDMRRGVAVQGGYLVNTPPMSLLFGLMCCYLGFGSGLFHASLTRWGQQLDVAAMYSPLVVFIAINLGRWIPRVKTLDGQREFPTWPVLACLVLVASFLLYQYKWSMSSAVVLPTLILAVGVFALLDRFRPHCSLRHRWLVVSVLALIAGRICWQLDVAGKFSGPDSWVQGHAVWHLLTGLSLAGTYLFYRSESNAEVPPGRVLVAS